MFITIPLKMRMIEIIIENMWEGSSLLSLSFFVSFFTGEVVLFEGRKQTIPLILIRYLHVLKAASTIHVDFTLLITSHDNRGHFTEVGSEANDGLGCWVLVAIRIHVEVSDHWGQIVLLEVPDFETTIVCD